MFKTIPEASEIKTEDDVFDRDKEILRALNRAVLRSEKFFELYGDDDYLDYAYNLLTSKGYRVSRLEGDDVQDVGYYPEYLKVEFK